MSVLSLLFAAVPDGSGVGMPPMSVLSPVRRLLSAYVRSWVLITSRQEIATLVPSSEPFEPEADCRCCALERSPQESRRWSLSCLDRWASADCADCYGCLVANGYRSWCWQLQLHCSRPDQPGKMIRANCPMTCGMCNVFPTGSIGLRASSRAANCGAPFSICGPVLVECRSVSLHVGRIQRRRSRWHDGVR